MTCDERTGNLLVTHVPQQRAVAAHKRCRKSLSKMVLRRRARVVSRPAGVVTQFLDAGRKASSQPLVCQRLAPDGPVSHNASGAHDEYIPLLGPNRPFLHYASSRVLSVTSSFILPPSSFPACRLSLRERCGFRGAKGKVSTVIYAWPRLIFKSDVVSHCHGPRCRSAIVCLDLINGRCDQVRPDRQGNRCAACSGAVPGQFAWPSG